jgi:hypothetical protein
MAGPLDNTYLPGCRMITMIVVDAQKVHPPQYPDLGES